MAVSERNASDWDETTGDLGVLLRNDAGVLAAAYDHGTPLEHLATESGLSKKEVAARISSKELRLRRRWDLWRERKSLAN